MSSLAERAAVLPPEKLALLQRRLAERRGSTAAAPGIPRRSRETPAPLSFAQERLWLIDRLQPGSAAYNIPTAVAFNGDAPAAAIEAALRGLVQRHEALRTTFPDDGGTPFQRVEPAARVRLPVLDLGGLPGPAARRVAGWLAAAQMARPFDLARGPLWRAALARLGQGAGEPGQVLLLTLHHAICDAWSLGVLARDLGAFFQAATGGPLRLAELPIQYADFAAWQRQRLRGRLAAEQLAYWRRQLDGAPALLELPTDRGRPAHQSLRGATISFRVPPGLARRLETLAQGRRATLFMTVLAAFEALLGRYTGVVDLVLGTPVANRGWTEVEGLIGFFLNTLVLRTSLAGDPTFLQLLGRVREVVLDAQAHQELPFDKLVQELRPDRHLSANPLFQVMFALEGGGSSEPGEPAAAEGGGEPSAGPIAGGTARSDLALAMVARPGSLTGIFEYSTDLFDAATIARMVRHLGVLLAGVAADPQRRLSELPLLTDAEAQQLREWNATGRPRPPVDTIHGLLAAQAARLPEAVAAAFEGRRLSYRELERRANRLANRLIPLGVGPEVVVGLFLERSPEMLVALFGVLAAGGAYLPLDPAYPRERLAYMLDDARVPLLVTQERLRQELPAHRTRVLLLAEDGAGLEDQSPAAPHSGATGDHLAYLIYTSGSTGRPKGVLVPHRGAVNLAAVEAEVLGLEQGDRVLQFASICFDASMFEMLMCLGSGAMLVLARRGDLLPGPALVRLLAERAVTVFPLPPSALAAVPPAHLPALRRISVMGEMCPRELVSRWRRVPGFFNAYGPTEATVWMAGCYLEPDRRPSIGRPVANQQFRLLDRHLGPVPVGVTGELYIRGIGVARGYHDRPSLTAERFLPDPSAPSPGERLYRTGDLARYLTDGRVDLLGRTDDQVKIRGFRIEPGEVEAVLARHPGVREVTVMAREDLPGGRGLAAYLAPVPGAEPTVEELRRFAVHRLPDYMIPAAFILLDRLPLNPSGKVDRSALPPPVAERPELAAAPVAAGTSLEEELVSMWQQVLGIEGIGIDDDFFTLGGHSILAVQLGYRIRDRFGVDLPLRQLFEASTVRRLAGVIGEALGGVPPAAEPAAPGAVTAPEEVELLSEAAIDRLLLGLPLSEKRRLARRALAGSGRSARRYLLAPAQKRLWFLDRLNPGNPAYNIPAVFSLPQGTRLAPLSAALREVSRRHEVLRTTFPVKGDGAVQRVAPDPASPLAVVDLAGLPPESGAATLQGLAAREASRPFDLARGPLWRAIALRADRGEATLLLTLHHIVADAWSMRVLMREIGVLYEAFAAGRPSPLAELPLQYGDVAQRQQEALASGALAAQLDYWRGRLAELPALMELPADRPRPAVQSSAGALLYFTLPRSLSLRLQELGRRRKATTFMTLLAAFQALLGRLTGRRQVVVGTPVANRDRREVEGLIGPFANTLVLVTEVGDAPSFLELLERVKEETLTAHAHQDLPFERLVEELQPERSLSFNPLFQVAFALENAPMPATGGARVVPAPAKFDLTLFLRASEDRLAGAAEYSADLFDATTVARWVGHLRTLLEGVVADPARTVDALPLLTAAEEQALRWEHNDTAAPLPAVPTLPRLIGERAAAVADGVAVVAGAEAVSYRALWGLARRVAGRLAERGAGPEARVGVAVERSVELLPALLGVLESGAAYVPLDPGYPRERLVFMAADSGVGRVLTQERFLPAWGERSALAVAVESWLDGPEPAPSAPPALRGDHLAYVLYTSGSSGRPKGVMIPHRAMVNHLVAMQRAHRPAVGERVLHKTPYSFDVASWELFLPLLAGATVVMARPGTHGDGAYLARLAAAERITTVHFVPSLLRAFLDEPAARAASGLQRIVASGEVLPPDLARTVAERLPAASLSNLYGPTEAAVEVTAWRCDSRSRSPSVPIGRPISNVRIDLLDAAMRPQPLGVPGELHIGGVALARGYQARPALTAEKLVPDPRGVEAGGRLYKTGDLARRLPAGEIEFLHRLDHQVKIRGLRIEPGEIEAVLAEHPGVGAAAVRVPSAAGGPAPRLVAYLVPRSEGLPEPEALRSWLMDRLPSHMVPDLLVPLEELPRTPNGKLDRGSLPPVPLPRSAQRTPPRTPLERAVAAIWSELLGVADLGVEDGFFELGGHSLLAFQAAARLRDALEVEPPLSLFFEAPTVAAFATALLAGGGRALEERARLLVEVAELADEEVAARIEAHAVAGRGGA